ncbi:MAG: hypothetical protein M1338_03305, partial [Patescibacteria group bacterium]|nr:hypothetical protein [Patescibacteria group bacterium]
MRKGFGIIEVVVAVSIMIIIVSGAAILEKNAIRNSVIASERTQAYNLAREGIEAVRAIRDTSWINGTGANWNSEFMQSGAPKKNQQIYYINNLDSPWVWALKDGSQDILLDQNSRFTRIINFYPFDSLSITSPLYILAGNPPKGSQNNPIEPSQFSQDNLIKVDVQVKWSYFLF